jgi:hypothetical protein
VCLPNRALVPPRPSGLPHRRNGAAASVPKRRPVGAGVTRKPHHPSKRRMARSVPPDEPGRPRGFLAMGDGSLLTTWARASRGVRSLPGPNCFVTVRRRLWSRIRRGTAVEQ